MPTIAKSELRKIRTAFNQCRFPSLSEHACHMRSLHRENKEFRDNHIAHNRRIAKTKKYDPVKYKKMQKRGRELSSDPEILKKRKEVIASRHIIRKQSSSRRVYDRNLYDRSNDYAGVVTMSEFNSL
jgi:hypothetical protein